MSVRTNQYSCGEFVEDVRNVDFLLERNGDLLWSVLSRLLL